MIAYFILVHRYPEQFKRMFRAVYVPGNRYVVHVDKSSGPELQADIHDFVTSYAGAEMLPARNALWGGYSLVDAELRGMAHLLEMDAGWTHYINLSGQDFPLKSQAYIRDFLRINPGRQFIRFADQKAVRPETMDRVGHVAIEAGGRMLHTGISRRYLPGAKPYIGTQWKAVTRAFCDFVCRDAQARRFKVFYRKSFIPDEGFFQSVLLNTRGHGEIVNDDLRTIDWIPDGDIKLRPRTFTVDDAAWLISSPDLFARKFDATEDSKILDLLEAHIGSSRTMAARPYDKAVLGYSPLPDPHMLTVGRDTYPDLKLAPA